MRIGNYDGRAILVEGITALDIADASEGRFGPEPGHIYERWVEFRQWAVTVAGPRFELDVARLGAPSPSPRQVFGIGLNYGNHAEEASMQRPEHPMVFTKFPSCITGPTTVVVVGPRMLVDWEVELVVVIGVHARHVPEARAWEHVAGLTIGQDLSDRRLQFSDQAPEQFSLGKSLPGFGPTGPYVVTVDELTDPMDLEVMSILDDEVVQSSRTSQMIFAVPSLVSELSSLLPLLPGDLIFTGTPDGVGIYRTPRRFIRPGEVLVTTIEGLGSMTTRFVTEQPVAGAG